MAAMPETTFHCPRCDRSYSSKDFKNLKQLEERVRKHVREQHPDYDPEWFDTFPDVVN